MSGCSEVGLSVARMCTRRSGLFDEMFCDEPHLQLIRAQHVTGQDVVGPGVPVVCRDLSGVPYLRDVDLVCLEQPGEHGLHLFGAIGWPGHGRYLRDMTRIADGDTTKCLHPFGHEV